VEIRTKGIKTMFPGILSLLVSDSLTPSPAGSLSQSLVWVRVECGVEGENIALAILPLFNKVMAKMV
jgi:hypothetical protein